jgi:iron complex transport system permease protein
MKVTLDITRLREEGRITADEYERLLQLGRHDAGSLGINILVGFGVIAVAAGLGAMLPSPYVVAAIGAVVFLIGLAFQRLSAENWSLLAQICLVTGALAAAGAIIALGEGDLRALLVVTALLAGAAIVARSSLLMVGAVMGLAACLGARSGYWHATYSLAIHEPVLTIVVFSGLAAGAYQVSKSLSSDYERIAINAARASVLLVNFGFWIGSLWGDRLSWLGGASSPLAIGRLPFSIGWALALLAIGIWGVKVNRRWVVNVAAIFGAIHFYTQWFDRLGASPVSFFVGGLLMLAFALGLWRFNRQPSGEAGLPLG